MTGFQLKAHVADHLGPALSKEIPPRTPDRTRWLAEAMTLSMCMVCVRVTDGQLRNMMESMGWLEEQEDGSLKHAKKRLSQQQIGAEKFARGLLPQEMESQAATAIRQVYQLKGIEPWLTIYRQGVLNRLKLDRGLSDDDEQRYQLYRRMVGEA